MEFARPHFLILLLLPFLLALLARGSLAGLSKSAARRALIFRSVVVGLVALALAGPRIEIHSRAVHALLLIDQSLSIDAEAWSAAAEFAKTAADARKGEDTLAAAGFAGHVVQHTDETGGFADVTTWEEHPDARRTDLPAALETAAAFLPAGGFRRVVVLSDGRPTESGSEEVTAGLKARGIEVDTVVLSPAPRMDALVREVVLPPSMRRGEPFDVRVKVGSAQAGRAVVRLFRDDLLAGSKETDLSAGDTEVVFENQKSAHDFSVFEAVVEMPDDAVAENNRRRAVAALRGAPLVLVVDPDESRMQPLMGALGELGIETEWRSPEGLPNTLEELERFDLFLLSDVPAVTVGPQRMELYRRWVRDFGGGFLLAGGENSFGAGGYYRTPIEEMLPVQMEHEDRRETPAVALVVVLDRSGSMAARIAGGQTKMSLANQGALYALQVLQPRDWFGLLAVDVQAHTIVPLSRVSGQEGWDRRILSVNAGGGGIYIYTSLAESLRLLRDSEARIKHVILFSDAADAEEKISGEMGGEQMGGSALDLTSAMLASGITTSVVALGREGDRDVLFLRALAERGAGRFYLTGDATTLPQIFTAETLKVSQSSLVEEPFQPVVGTASEITKGIDWSEAPLLLGYNTTKPKPTAEIPLVTEFGEPLLAVWRFGLGNAAAYTSDAKARWASEWLSWPGFGQFWAQTVRALMRREDSAPVHAVFTQTRNKLLLRLEAQTVDGDFRDGLSIRVLQARAGSDEKVVETAAAQIAPGTYEAEFPLPGEGEYFFSVFVEGEPSGRSFGWSRGYSPEYLSSGPDPEFLSKLADAGGGKFNPEPADIFRVPPGKVSRPLELAPWLLALALVLFPVDIWFRRRG